MPGIGSIGGIGIGEAPLVEESIWLGGGGPASGEKYAYHAPYDIYKAKKQQENIVVAKQNLDVVQDKLFSAKQDLETLKASRSETKQITLKLEDEINVLLIQRAQLIRMIDEEEAILVLLMSLPFMN